VKGQDDLPDMLPHVRSCQLEPAVLANRENGSNSDPMQGHIADGEGQQ
jgi:hypothetical protein